VARFFSEEHVPTAQTGSTGKDSPKEPDSATSSLDIQGLLRLSGQLCKQDCELAGWGVVKTPRRDPLRKKQDARDQRGGQTGAVGGTDLAAREPVGEGPGDSRSRGGRGPSGWRRRRREEGGRR
jgi:hypothetical protein